MRRLRPTVAGPTTRGRTDRPRGTSTPRCCLYEGDRLIEARVDCGRDHLSPRERAVAEANDTNRNEQATHRYDRHHHDNARNTDCARQQAEEAGRAEGEQQEVVAPAEESHHDAHVGRCRCRHRPAMACRRRDDEADSAEVARNEQRMVLPESAYNRVQLLVAGDYEDEPRRHPVETEPCEGREAGRVDRPVRRSAPETSIESGAETIENAVEMFDEIAAAIEEAETGITEISRATDDQAASSEEVVSMIDEVSSVSQQTAAEATTVSAASEEQTSSLSEVTMTIERLSQTAEELHDSVDDFEVDGSGSAGQAVVDAAKEVASRSTTETAPTAQSPADDGASAPPATNGSATHGGESPAAAESGAAGALLAAESVAETDMASSGDSVPWSDIDGGTSTDAATQTDGGRADDSGTD